MTSSILFLTYSSSFLSEFQTMSAERLDENDGGVTFEIKAWLQQLPKE